MIIKLKKTVLCPGPLSDKGKKIVKINKGACYGFDGLTFNEKYYIAYKKREAKSKRIVNYQNCIKFLKDDFDKYFETVDLYSDP